MNNYLSSFQAMLFIPRFYMNKYAKHLTDIAYLPMNDYIRDEISDVMSALFEVINKDSDNTNEFIELGKEFDKAQIS